LYPCELDHIAHAVRRRRSEFSTGRWLSRRSLVELGIPARPIPVGPAREPVWPSGVVGSLTHSSSTCIVVLGFSHAYQGIGVDLELSGPADSELADIVVSPSEPPEYRLAKSLTLVFSAKESVFKCLYPVCHTSLDFHDIDIALDRSAATFSAAVQGNRVSAAQLTRAVGYFATAEQGVLTLFAMPQLTTAFV
jgi:4'-phosphopantetheinyl transferase EntD